MSATPPPDRLTEGARSTWPRLAGAPIAHRGLWSPDGAPENSLAAFDAACRAGYGMELDVQLSADGEAVVFHDDRLEHRLTTACGRVAEHSAAELTSIRIGSSAETIPTLAQALQRVAGRSLLVIELKVFGGDEGPLERRVAELLDEYGGPAAVISFNPHTVAWFAERRPGLLRGLDSSAYHDALNWPLAAEQRRSLAELEHVALARPQFLALGLDMLPSRRGDELRASGLPVVAWTVRSPAQWERVRPHCDNLMFEGWRP